MNRVRSFTVDSDFVCHALYSEVGIGKPSTNVVLSPECESLVGLWDTGATSCAIKSSAAACINAQPIGRVIVGGVHGQQECNQYMINLYLPNRICLQFVPATELSNDAGFDLLIGMDVITMGDFSTSTLDEKTSFTFRIPSCQKQDFVAYRPKDTVVCACGSGMMYKNCCKKLIRAFQS
jgi:hypothetical protein